MNLLRYKQSELLQTIILVLVIPIWLGLASEWYLWYGGEGNGVWMKKLYMLLDNRSLVNIPICIILTYLAVTWVRITWEDQEIRLYRLVLIIIGLCCLYYKSEDVVYAMVIWRIDYKLFLGVLLSFMMLWQVIKICRFLIDISKSQKKENVFRVKGFSTDSIASGKIPENLKAYASEITKRLLATNIKQHSYAIGVTGEWGTGKTTFLEILQEQIKDKAEVVNFNPWMCRTPEQVTQDFFASLRHQLSFKYSTLSKSIKEYAKYVNKVTLTLHAAFNLDVVFPRKGKSLYERKQDLSDKFSMLPRPVVVIIDDIDRLEREEVFEVLRLIRNTADLKNTIYIVAYDKRYVTSVLEEKNIQDASSYMEKIFPVEIHLPKVDNDLIWATLYADIEDQNDDVEIHDFAKKLFKHFDASKRALILRILGNYRSAKRFARLYMLNLNYQNKRVFGEIRWLDLFWLELLQVYDSETYDRLANEPLFLLWVDGDRYKLRKGVLNENTKNMEGPNTFVGEKFWKAETPNILYIMFGAPIKPKAQSVCMRENFDKYFAMSISPHKLSFKESRELLKDGINQEALIDRWIDEGKYLYSINYQLKQINQEALSEDELKRYLHSVLYFGLRLVDYKKNFIQIDRMLAMNSYKGKMVEIGRSIIMSWVLEKQNDEKILCSLSKLLNSLYSTTVYDEEDSFSSCCLIITNDDIENLLKKTILAYLKRHPDTTALEVMKVGSMLYKLFGNCCVVKEERAMEDSRLYKQVAFDIIIDYFAQKKDKPTKEEYEKAMEEIFYIEKPEFLPDEDYSFFVEEMYEGKMQEHFGSSYEKKLSEFKVKCFV